MRGKRRTEMTIETHRVFVMSSSGNSRLGYCPQCAAETRMIMPEAAALMSCVSTRTIFRWVETGRIHFMETSEGILFVCLQSLMERLSESFFAVDACEQAGRRRRGSVVSRSKMKQLAPLSPKYLRREALSLGDGPNPVVGDE